MKWFAAFIALLFTSPFGYTVEIPELPPNPYINHKAVVYKEAGDWYIHVIAHKNRVCDGPEVIVWQRSDKMSLISGKFVGTNTKAGPIDHTWPAHVKELPGIWRLEYTFKWDCPEGSRYSNMVSEPFMIK